LKEIFGKLDAKYSEILQQTRRNAKPMKKNSREKPQKPQKINRERHRHHERK
jgi:hypothetical protein